MYVYVLSCVSTLVSFYYLSWKYEGNWFSVAFLRHKAEKLKKDNPIFVSIIVHVVSTNFSAEEHKLIHNILIKIGENLHKTYPYIFLGNNNEFVILTKKSNFVYANIISIMGSPMTIEDNIYNINLDIGIGEYDTNSSKALTRARENRISSEYLKIYSSILNASEETQVIDYTKYLLTSFKELTSFNEDNFTCYYQPQKDIATNKIVCVEALARWNTGKKMLCADEFISYLDSKGKLIELLYVILNIGFSKAAQWKDLNIGITINLPTKALTLEIVAEIERYSILNSLDPRLIKLEIDNNIAPTKSIMESLLKLQNLGFSIVLDNFGINLNYLYLAQLDIKEVKIDKSLVSCLATPEGIKLYKSVIDMCNTLELIVTAVGIETKDNYKKVKELGVHRVQGYFVSKPLNASNINKDCLLNLETLSVLNT
jgi:EAL domain-containing protein (putative c-di-GMP-specific phosphodiesterase class I)